MTLFSVLEWFQGMDRRYVFLGMAVAMIVPMLVPMTLGFEVDERVQALYDEVEQVPPGSTVLISADFDPASRDGENQRILLAIGLQSGGELLSCILSVSKHRGISHQKNGRAASRRHLDTVRPKTALDHLRRQRAVRGYLSPSTHVGPVTSPGKGDRPAHRDFKCSRTFMKLI
jgi:hypothetical protein